MRRSSAVLLQTVIVLLGAGALVFLLWEPHVEGRNAHASAFEIYFKDPFLAYAYIASIPFFFGLHQAFKALGRVKHGETSSPASGKALRTIKYCALAVIGFVAASVIFIAFEDGDDRPQGIFMRILVAVPSAVVAASAAKLERVLQKKAAA